MTAKYSEIVDESVNGANAEVQPGETQETEVPAPVVEPSVWEDLLKEDDEVVETVAPEVKAAVEEPTPAAEEPPVVPEEKPKVEEPKAAVAPQEPPKPAVQPEAAAPVAAAPVETPPAKSKEELAKERKEWREQAEARLSTYLQSRLTPEEIEELRLEPEKVLPKFVARSYLDVYDAMLEDVQSRIPGLVNQVQAAESQARQREQQFYDKWPSLNKPEYREVVNRTVMAYRQANPQASFEQAVQEAGMMATVVLRLPVPGTEQPAAAAPAAPAVTRPAMSPAAPTARGAPPKAKPTNPFTIMAEEFLEEDKG